MNLAGVYIADYTAASEKLELYASGDYIQTVTIKSTAKTYSASGRWTYDPDPKKRYLMLEDSIVVLDGTGNLSPTHAIPQKGNAYLIAQKRFGKLTLSTYFYNYVKN